MSLTQPYRVFWISGYEYSFISLTLSSHRIFSILFANTILNSWKDFLMWSECKIHRFTWFPETNYFSYSDPLTFFVLLNFLWINCVIFTRMFLNLCDEKIIISEYILVKAKGILPTLNTVRCALTKICHQYFLAQCSNNFLIEFSVTMTHFFINEMEDFFYFSFCIFHNAWLHVNLSYTFPYNSLHLRFVCIK